MKIIVNKPAAPPPPTFDLLGLTEEEVRIIRAAFGQVDMDYCVKRGVDWITFKNLSNTITRQTGVRYQMNGDPH